MPRQLPLPMREDNGSVGWKADLESQIAIDAVGPQWGQLSWPTLEVGPAHVRKNAPGSFTSVAEYLGEELLRSGDFYCQRLRLERSPRIEKRYSYLLLSRKWVVVFDKRARLLGT